MHYTVGVIISFFLCLLLLGKKGKNAADYLLSFWLGWIGLHLLLYFLFISQKLFDFPILLGLSLPMPLVHPPLLYLYTAALCRGRLPKRWWLHFMLVLGCYLYLIPFILSPDEHKIWVFKNGGAGYEGFVLFLSIAINLSGLAYTVSSWRLLRKHRRVIDDLFSNEEKINLKWLLYLIYGIGGIWLAVLWGNDAIVFGCSVLFVLFIGYFGIQQGGIFTNQPALLMAQTIQDEPDFPFLPLKTTPHSTTDLSDEPSNSNEENPQAPYKKKYEKSGLTTEAEDALHRRLQDLMTSEKLFKESELSLTDLAEKMDTHPNYLSQIINMKEGKNFYDYVNSMRVEAFLKMAAAPENQQFTLLGLAYDCGFNSKSTFNRYFKKVTGQSPSEYLKRE